MPGDIREQWRISKFVGLGLVALFVLIFGFAGWLATARVSGAIIAQGQLIQDRENVVIQHITGGVVQEVLVAEGDRVQVNAPLIRLDGSAVRSELKIVEAQVFELLARQGRLRAERGGGAAISNPPELIRAANESDSVAQMIAGQARLFSARNTSWMQELATLDKQAAQITIQIAGFEAQLRALRVQSGLINIQLSDQQSLLDKGLAKSFSVLSLNRQAAGIQGDIGALVAQVAGANAKIAEIEINILRRRALRRENSISQLRNLEFRLTELTEQRRSLARRVKGLTLVAPAGGVVFGLGRTSALSVVSPAQELMWIAPDSRNYLIVARIALADVDQLNLDQQVRIQFPTLEQSRTTPAYGTLSQISAGALVNPATGGSYYRAEIQFSKDTAATIMDRDDIFADIPVDVFIITSGQPVWRYLAEPVIGYLSRAFRES